MKAMLRAAAFLLFGCIATTAQAQEAYPAKPVRIVVGNPAGGGTDVIARLVAQKMAEGLGQPFIVENKPGAVGIVAGEYVARASPDGYTLMLATSGQLVQNVVMYAKLPYASRDFAPVSLVSTFPLILVVNAALPIRSIPELVAYAKANPMKANYAASNVSFQLAVELFKSRTGSRLEYVPYKSSGDLISAVLSGDALMTLIDTGPVFGTLKGGKVRGLAVTTPSRVRDFPDIPTMAEVGFPELQYRGWFGLVAPAGTPANVLKRLEVDVNRIVRLPDVKEAMAKRLVEATGSTPEEMARLIATETALWDKVRKAANLKLQDQ
jgi:tripartite-type tricarboxylate transporter receptor subunit TctC